MQGRDPQAHRLGPGWYDYEPSAPCWRPSESGICPLAAIKTRRGDKTNLDDQCRLVAAGDVLTLGEHIPYAGNDQDPECRPGHRIERAGGHVRRLPTERPQGRYQGG